MKLLKIGSAQTNDIVLHSSFVSGYHAELTVLDNGEIILEDKSSSNGTYVGDRRIEPNTEVTIRRGDYVRFADTELVWAKVPAAPNLSAYKNVVNIGSNFRNEIVINSGVVSRYHATLLVKKGQAYIRDNGSKNGTQLNGVKIPAGKEMPIKKGDNLICGGEDITDQIAQYLPAGAPKFLKFGGIAAAVVVLLACLVYFIPWPGKNDPRKFIPAVVYLTAEYQYVVEFEDNPLPDDVWDGTYLLPYTKTYTGTAFFVDRQGRLATNRHIAAPWEYRTKDDDDQIRNTITSFVQNVTDDRKALKSRMESEIFKSIVNHGVSQVIGDQSRKLDAINTLLARLSKSSYKIKGKLLNIYVGYPGLYYSHYDDFARCNVLRYSKDKEKDLALLQLNNHQTPEQVTDIFNLEKVYTGKLEPLKDNLYTIGYPNGTAWGIDESTKSLKPSLKKTVCSKEPGRYTFELQESSNGGSSGSPIFNENGQLVGVLFGGYQNASTLGVHARYLKELYDEEVDWKK